MKLTGPIITLVAGAGLAGVLLVANLHASSGSQAESGASAAADTTRAAASAQPTRTAQAAASAQPTGTAAAGTATAVTAVRRASYVGHVAGAGRLALVVRDGVAIAYLCDGRAVEAWLSGSAEGGSLKLSGKQKASLVGSYDSAHASGTIVTSDISRRFDIPRVTKPSGLYKATARLRGATVRTGWIVLPDGSQVGLLTTDGSAAQAAPRLDPASRTATIGGTTLTAVPVDGDTGSGF